MAEVVPGEARDTSLLQQPLPGFAYVVEPLSTFAGEYIAVSRRLQSPGVEHTEGFPVEWQMPSLTALCRCTVDCQYLCLDVHVSPAQIEQFPTSEPRIER